MNNFTIIVKNSYCEIQGNIESDIESMLSQILTTHNDIEAEVANLFYRMKMLNIYGLKYKKDETPEQNATRVRQSMHIHQSQLKKLQDNEYVYWYQNRKFPTGHLNIIKDLLESLKVSYKLEDVRKKIQPHMSFPWKTKPHDPRYYQSEMIKLGLETGRGVFESAVGTGKTLIMEYLIKEIAVTSLIIVPSKGLKTQVSNELEEVFGSNLVQKIEGAQVRKGVKLKPIRIVTIQTVAALQKSGDLHLLMDDVEAMFVDEIHHAGSASYTNILPFIDHIYWRFGFTGTFMRNDSKSLDLWGFLSVKLYTYPAWKAIEDGFLTPIDVITYNLHGVKKGKYPAEYDANYCASIKMKDGSFKIRPDAEILSGIAGIINSVSPADQILILVSRKDKGGAMIHQMIQEMGIGCTYISGDDDSETINNAIQDFNAKKITILIGSSVVGEGIDVRSTDHLILAQGGKSEIVIVQAIGRLVRLFKDKMKGYVHDFNFKNTKYMNRHYDIRRDIIERNFQPQNWTEI